jgi:predicted transglutaminase-like cysteine proteinase
MKTAMQQMLDELMAHEYTIPLELIVKCKKLIEVEKEQVNPLVNALNDIKNWDEILEDLWEDPGYRAIAALKIYKEKYTNGL